MSDEDNEDRCDKCRFYREDTEEGDGGDTFSSCHRFPPVFIPDRDPMMVYAPEGWRWPKVYGFQSCGEFQPRQPDKPA